jgi:hypothetical protein
VLKGAINKAKYNDLIFILINLLDSFTSLYLEHSNKACKDYLSYFSKGFSDEKTLIQPIIFPTFLKEILNFTNLDYIPEKRNLSNKAPDFKQCKAEYMALNKNLFEPMLSWKFITVSKVGSNHVVSMTNEGRNALRFLNI